MALLTYKKVIWVKNIILGAGDYDLTSVKEFRPPFYEFLKKEFKLSEIDFKERSPLLWIDEVSYKIPILIFHGTMDKSCDILKAYKFAIKLQKNEFYYKLIVYPKGTHGLIKFQNEINDQIINWIN